MLRIHPLFLLSALPLIACGGGDGDDDITPEGPHYTYVASEATVPSTPAQARAVGLDLDGNGVVDNKLGDVLGALKMAMIDAQGAITAAIDAGGIALLVDVQTSDFTASSAAGIQVKIGDPATIQPAPCTDPAMPTTCRKHLDGAGSFTISASSPTDAALTGKIAGGVFSAGPGDVTLEIALAAAPIRLDLIGARAKLTGITADGVASIIVAGGLTKDTINNSILPAVYTQVMGSLVNCSIRDHDNNVDTPNQCTCDEGQSILTLLDTNKDCATSLEEIQTNMLITTLLAPDVKIGDQDVVSIGIGAKAVKATIR